AEWPLLPETLTVTPARPIGPDLVVIPSACEEPRMTVPATVPVDPIPPPPGAVGECESPQASANASVHTTPNSEANRRETREAVCISPPWLDFGGLQVPSSPGPEEIGGPTKQSGFLRRRRRQVYCPIGRAAREPGDARWGPLRTEGERRTPCRAIARPWHPARFLSSCRSLTTPRPMPS